MSTDTPKPVWEPSDEIRTLNLQFHKLAYNHQHIVLGLLGMWDEAERAKPEFVRYISAMEKLDTPDGRLQLTVAMQFIHLMMLTPLTWAPAQQPQTTQQGA